jgi:hypothetical protein
MNLYSIKPHDGEELYYATGNSFGQAVSKYKTRRSTESHKIEPPDGEPWPSWKDVPEPAKVVLVCMADRLVAGRDGSEQ